MKVTIGKWNSAIISQEKIMKKDNSRTNGNIRQEPKKKKHDS
jgi:hypothetical protein